MARYYLTAAAAPYSPATLKGAWDDTADAVTKKLSTDKATDGGTNTALTVSTGTTSGFDSCLYRGVSPALAAGVISGYANLCMRVKEAVAGQNLFYHVHLWVTQGDSDTVRGTLVNDYVEATNEWPTGNSTELIAAPIVVTPVTVQAGDRLVLEVGYNQQSTTGGTATVSYGGTAGDATDGGLSNLAAWLDVPAPNTTRLYFNNAAAAVTPGATRGTWDQAVSTDQKLDVARSGAETTQASGETGTATPWDLLVLRLVSDVLDAQTIAGTLDWAFLCIQSNTAPDMTTKLHAYVMASDGSVRGTLLANHAETTANEWAVGTVTAATRVPESGPVALSSVNAQNGDRIVIELGARCNADPTTGGYSARIRYGGTTAPDAISGGGNVGTGWVEFSQGLAFGGGAPVAGGGRSQAIFVG